MLNRLIPFVGRLRNRNPKLYDRLVAFARRFLKTRLGIYPRLLGDEIGAVTGVLKSSQWNMAYGRGLAHERLEAAFAEFVGVSEAVAVGSGGMALQMSMRALGLRPGDEVVHQVDTCAATAMAVMNAGATPVFADISERTFMLDVAGLHAWAGPATRAVIATHSWGNPEAMASLRTLADAKGWKLIEDACQALGAVADSRPAGAWGDVGVFSFGCIKPIQAGEGGLIVTNDSTLAKELRAMRHWGDRTIEFGVRDATELSWNGRMSEIVAAVVTEQLRGYRKHLAELHDNVEDFVSFIAAIPGLSLVLGESEAVRNNVFSQVVLRIDERELGRSKRELWDSLAGRGVQVWHANFEAINSLSFFRRDTWRQWVLRGDLDRIASNYHATFPTSAFVFNQAGLGLGKMNFLSKQNLRHLKESIHAVLTKGAPA